MRRHRSRAHRRTTWAALVLLALAALAATSSASAQEQPYVTIHLNERNDSGIEGTATLTANNGTTLVTVEITGTDDEIPIHIHAGTCDDLNPVPTYPLTNATSREPTTTTIDAMLTDLVMRPFAVNAHQPADHLEALLDPSQVVACGNIVNNVGGVVADVNEEPWAPKVGTGAAAASSADRTLLIGFVAVACALGVGGLLMRRRETVV